MRAIAPILKALHSRRSLLPAIGKLTDVMEITPEETQDKAKGLVCGGLGAPRGSLTRRRTETPSCSRTGSTSSGFEASLLRGMT